MGSEHHLLPAAGLPGFSEGRLGVGDAGLRLVGWVDLMLCFALAFEVMEMEHSNRRDLL